ncbi:MAG: tripartite tricarboxylate transporter substrate binding protein [Deltaproteobacteria bacterium]|nr:tripartite tricarboxylate transporter substrate binding protein [Deltaproteobacteria bacterium]
MSIHEKGIKLVLAAAMIVFFSLGMGQGAMAEYPEKEINMFIPFAAGGSVDTMTRVLASEAEKVLGKPIVLLNKPGGAGTVALGILSKEKPDGYTLSTATSIGIFGIPVMRKVPYKPLASFTNIFSHARASLVGLVVKADSPWKTWQEFIDHASKNPGKVKYSTTGTGSVFHVAMELVAKNNNTKLIHVPFKGTMPALTALLGGHVEACSSGPAFMRMVKQGQLRLLSIYADNRSPLFPDVPTLKETGYDYSVKTYFGVHGPAGIDPAIVKKLEKAFGKAVDTPAFKKIAKRFAMQTKNLGSQEYTRLLEDGWTEQVKIYKDLGLIKKVATQPR